jgi:hypothetical protein
MASPGSLDEYYEGVGTLSDRLELAGAKNQAAPDVHVSTPPLQSVRLPTGLDSGGAQLMAQSSRASRRRAVRQTSRPPPCSIRARSDE